MNELISVGDKLELKQITFQDQNVEKENKILVSQILDLTDTTIQAAMPIYEGKLIPLQIGTKYEVFFKTSDGLYKAICDVIRRDKIDNIYIVDLKPITDLEKFQRREYFRLNTTMDASVCVLTDAEWKLFEHKGITPEDFQTRLKDVIIVDISGGGAKFISKTVYEKNNHLLMQFTLPKGTLIKELFISAKVISSSLSENRADLHEHRIQFKKITREFRELIIKYILDEQRKIRQKERGW